MNIEIDLASKKNQPRRTFLVMHPSPKDSVVNAAVVVLPVVVVVVAQLLLLQLFQRLASEAASHDSGDSPASTATNWSQSHIAVHDYLTQVLVGWSWTNH